MDLRKLKSLIDLVSDSEISELEISEGEDRVKIVRSSKKQSSTNNKQREVAKDDFSLNEVSITKKINTDSISDSKSSSDLESNFEIIKSPMVGTFYRAPAPNSKAFVNVNDEITENQTLCVIEAMKLMNEIPSNTSGKITEIFVENGQPVEFGQPLFRLEKK